MFFGDVNLKKVIIKGNISEDSNISNIFSNEAQSVTLYGNETVKLFVERYNENNTNHIIKYSQIEDL